MSCETNNRLIKDNCERLERVDHFLTLSEESIDELADVMTNVSGKLSTVGKTGEDMTADEMHAMGDKVSNLGDRTVEKGVGILGHLHDGAKKISTVAKDLAHKANEHTSPIIAKWRQDREVARERLIRDFTDRRALTNTVRKRLDTLAEKIKLCDQKTVTLKTSRLRNFIDGETIPSSFTTAVQSDASLEGQHFQMLVDQQDHALRMYEAIFNHMDTSSDAQFDSTFLNKIGQIDTYGLQQIFDKSGTHYLGNRTVLLENTLRDRPDFISDFAQRNNYRFRSQAMGYDFNTEVSLSKNDVLALIAASRRYLTSLENSEKRLMKQNRRFEELMLNAYRIESNDDPKRRIDTIVKHRVRAQDLQAVIMPLQLAFDRVTAPMYTDIQRKSMALMHIVEQWYIDKTGESDGT